MIAARPLGVTVMISHGIAFFVETWHSVHTTQLVFILDDRNRGSFVRHISYVRQDHTPFELPKNWIAV